MQGRSLSKQNRPHPQNMQMTAYHEAGGASGQQHVPGYQMPTSISARKGYPRNQQQMVMGTSQQSSTKLTAPIKSLQQKHKHYEMQLAWVSQEIANEHDRLQKEAVQRQKYIKPASNAPHINYASPMDRQMSAGNAGQIHNTNKQRVISKDRSGSGQKRFKPNSQNINLKVTSPQRSDKMTLGSQNSTSKLDRDKQLKDIINQKGNIIGHLKKPSDSRVIVKIASKGAKTSNSSANLAAGLVSQSLSQSGTPVTAILNQKSAGLSRGGAGGGNSATRQYYAVNSSAGAHAQNNNQLIDLSSQQHNVSVSNGSSRAISNHQNAAANNGNFSNTVGMAGHGLHHQPDSDLNRDHHEMDGEMRQHHQYHQEDDQSLRESFENHDQAAISHNLKQIITPVNRKQIRGASGPRYPQSRHFDAPQPYSNHKLRQQSSQIDGGHSTHSPERGASASHANTSNMLFYRQQQVQQQVNNYMMSGANDISQSNNVNNNAPSSDIVRNLETGILSLHGHLKTLEGKYIDLANYYKQELIQSSSSNLQNQSQTVGDAGLQDSTTKMIRPSSSSTSNQRKHVVGSAKRTASRESASTLANNNHQHQQYNVRKAMANDMMKRTTPRLEGRSFSKGSAGGLRNFEEYKDTQSQINNAQKRQSQSKNYRLDQAQERSIIEEVKSQKQKLENEMRNLINLYSQICEEDIFQNSRVATSPGLGSLKPFQSRYSTSNNNNNQQQQQQAVEDQIMAQQNEILSQLLYKYQNQLLTQSEYQESYEKSIEKTFEELFEELSSFFHSSMADFKLQQRATIGRLPALSLMDRIEKLGGDYDIQQEYSLSNLKETMFQIQHTNDQFQLDLKKISLDFSQIQKKLLVQDQNQDQAELSLDDLVGSLDQVSNGISSMSKRVSQNEQKLQFLAENHGESVRYLREYRENFRRITSEYALQTSQTNQSNVNGQLGELSGDQMSVNQSYGGLVGNSGSSIQQRQQAEITQLNQEIFHLRTQLADAKQNGLIDLNDLRDQLDQLTSENASLYGKVGDINQELATKQSQLTQRDAQNAELVQKLNQPAVQVQTAQIFEGFWRQNCQSMVDLCQKFLHSMRRLQKVVHRKETNVQQEKQDFETAKKELESNLKEVKRQLENQPQFPPPVSAGIDLSEPRANEGVQKIASTSARPNMLLSSNEQVFQQHSQPSHAQSMRLHQPQLRSQFSNLHAQPSADQHSLQLQQSTDQSVVPSKQQLQQTPSVVHLENQVSDLKTEAVSTNKSLKKERQKVQQLLNDLKISQENLQKMKLTYVPQENVNELESSVKQLQDTIREHENQDQEHKKLIQELKMSVNDKQMNIYELTRLANEQQNQQQPDFTVFLQAVADQANEIISGQASWLQSIEQHIANKEEQVSEMFESVEQVSRTVTEKNDAIKALLAENEQLSALVQEQDQLTSQHADELQGQIGQLRGELNVKKNGNVMMNALMRGLKQKLDEEMAKNRQVIESQSQNLARQATNINNQQEEIQQFSQVVQQQNKQVELLQAKIDKKKFKQTQSKQLMASSEQNLTELQSRVKSSQKLIQQKAQAEAEMQQEVGKLRGELNIKKNGNVMMNALMRGLKQKLEEEMAKHRQTIEGQQADIQMKEVNIRDQQEEIQQFSQVVQQQNKQVELLQAKIDKKKLKSTQSKQLVASSEQNMNELHSRVKSSQKILQQKDEAEAKLKAEVERLKGQVNSSDKNMNEMQTNVQNSQKQLQQKQEAEANLSAEVGRLNGELNVKKNGNVMMNALMRGLKQKLDEELAKNRQTIDNLANEIQSQARVDQEKTNAISQLQAKLEKKKFKTIQTKQVLAETSEQLGHLKSYNQSSDQAFEQLREQNAKLQGTLKIKSNGNVMMNALMRGLKQKLDEELAKNRQTIDNLANEIQSQARVDQEKTDTISQLQAKIEKKKFKTIQTKQVLAETSEQLGHLKSYNQSSDQAFEQLREQNAKLQGTLKIKSNGNVMMNALMRGLKQKLEEEMARSRKTIEEQKQDISKSANEVVTLRAKVEKKKFKQTQFKQHAVKIEAEQQAIYGKKRVVEEQLGKAEQDLNTHKQTVEDLQNEMIEMQELFDQELASMQTKGTELETQLENALKTAQKEKQELLKAAKEQVKEAREQQTQLTLKTASVEQLEAAGNQDAVFEIRELRIENTNQKQINEERDSQATDYNNKLTESKLIASQLQNSLESLKNDHKVESDALNRELETLRDSITKSETKLTQLRTEKETETQAKEEALRSLEERQSEIVQLQERNAALVSQHEAFKAEQDTIQKDLRQDRDTAQAQLSDFINQTKYEKESLEGKLQHQLNQTLTQLNTREDECEDLQRQLNQLKEEHAQQGIELNEKTGKLDKRKAKVTQMKALAEGQEVDSRGDKAALEQSRELVLQFKAKLQANDELVGAKDEEIQNLRARVEALTNEIAEKTNQITEHEDDLHTLQGELQSKTEEVTRALTQVDAFQTENERLNTQNAQFKDQISQLKLEFEAKSNQLESDANNERQKAKEKDELITEAEGLLADFNNEKHEVKAKFKHMMQLLQLKAAGSENSAEVTNSRSSDQLQSPSRTMRASNPSSYKGRAGEVDLNHCFGELEQIVLEFKAKQESRIVELISDKEQLAGTVHEQKQDLEAMQASLASLQEKLDEANHQFESNDGEARNQIDTAVRKITNYKTKVTEKKQTITGLEQQVAALTAQLTEAQTKVNTTDKSGMDESYLALQKENLQLLERLQKHEKNLQKARDGDAPSDEEDKKAAASGSSSSKITMSPEVTQKLNEVDARMIEIKRDLHQAKSSCLKDMLAKYNEELKTAQKNFVREHLLIKAINGDKVTGWNNIVKECKSIQFADKHFMLVQDVSESKFYLVDTGELTETAVKYLKAHIEEYSDEEFIQDVVGRSVQDMDEDPEIEKLKALVTDLRQDRIELQAELEQFRESGKMDTSRIAQLKDEEMKDDIEYLTSENKELSFKVKMVCETKASLQLQLAQALKRLRMQEEQQDISAIGIGASLDRKLNPVQQMEPARNIDDEIFPPVEEQLEESSRMPDRGPKDYLSDQDSLNDIVGRMSREDDDAAAQADDDEGVKQLRLKLQSSQAECQELKDKLNVVEQKVKASEQKKEQDEDEDAMIPHIKVTLIQFLRNVAITDRQNEDLLTIIFNMMEFTDVEITDLKMSRMAIKMVKGKPGRAASSSVGMGGGNSTNSMSKDDDGQGKPKRGGIFGMFNKKKDAGNQSGTNASGGGSMPPGMRPKPAPRR